jgi:hypothetical protein
MPNLSEIGSYTLIAVALVAFMVLAPVIGVVLGFLIGLFVTSSLAYNLGTTVWDALVSWVRRRRA